MSRAAYLTIRTACVTVELRWTVCQSKEVCVCVLCKGERYSCFLWRFGFKGRCVTETLLKIRVLLYFSVF